MGLLDLTPEYNEQVITKSLITAPKGLNFGPFRSLPNTHFRRDVFIIARNLTVSGVAMIEIPGDFKDGDEVKLSITFRDIFIYRGGLKYEDLKGKIQPIRYQGSLYEYIQKVASDDYIIDHILGTIGD
jgi:hypothetical protein